MTGLLLSDPWTLHLSQMQPQNPLYLTQHFLDCTLSNTANVQS